LRICDAHNYIPPAQGCVVSGSRDTSLRCFDLRTGRVRHVLHQHLGGVTSVCLDPLADGGKGVLLSGARDATVQVGVRAPPNYLLLVLLADRLFAARC